MHVLVIGYQNIEVQAQDKLKQHAETNAQYITVNRLSTDLARD